MQLGSRCGYKCAVVVLSMHAGAAPDDKGNILMMVMLEREMCGSQRKQ